MTDAPAAPAFGVPNVGAGPDPCSLWALAPEYECLVFYFMRDHECPACRRQTQRTRDRVDGFRARESDRPRAART